MSSIEFKNGSKITAVDNSGENKRGKVRMISYDMAEEGSERKFTFIIPETTKALKVSFEEE